MTAAALPAPDDVSLLIDDAEHPNPDAVDFGLDPYEHLGRQPGETDFQVALLLAVAEMEPHERTSRHIAETFSLNASAVRRIRSRHGWGLRLQAFDVTAARRRRSMIEATLADALVETTKVIQSAITLVRKATERADPADVSVSASAALLTAATRALALVSETGTVGDEIERVRDAIEIDPPRVRVESDGFRMALAIADRPDLLDALVDAVNEDEEKAASATN